MVTGLALLISGYTQLGCGISAYHWQTTIYLVWFSSLTHLSTLTFLRQYFYENRPLLWGRLFFICLIAGLLLGALAPTGSSDWTTSSDTGTITLSIPAQCFYNQSGPPYGPFGGTQGPVMIVSALILSVGSIARGIKLFARSSEFSRKVLRRIPSDKIKSLMRTLYIAMGKQPRHKWVVSVPYWSLLTIFLVSRACFDIFESMLWEV